MKAVIYTERGIFSGKHYDADDLSEHEELAQVIYDAANGQGTSLTLATESGHVIIPRELLKTAVFEIKM